MRRPKASNRSDYFRILDSYKLPEIGNVSARYSKGDSPEKTAQRIVKSQQFVYIDLDQESGCRVMQKQEPVNNEQQVQKIGNSYIWNLKNLSQQNQLTIQYLSKQKQSQHQKQSLRIMLKNELDNSISKLNKRKNYRLNYQQFKEQKQNQFDPMKLRELVEQDYINQLNQNIWQKEKRLIDKFGISGNYISVSPKNKSARASFIKGRLPALNFKTIDK